MAIAIIVHGGAKPIEPEEFAANQAGTAAAVRAGWEILERGGSALDAVEAAIRVLEDDPTFNAGYGSALNSDGEIEMDASLMEGSQLQAGAVAAMRGVRHPISIARQLLPEQTVFLVAEGAQRFAREHGAELCEPQALITEQRRQKWAEHNATAQSAEAKDTVGCVALDAAGNIAAGASTGGLMHNLPGRVGDSPLIGCGVYADDTLGGCSNTGDGESIMRVVLAKTAMDLLQNNTDPDTAAEQAIALFKRRVPGEAGCILLDPQGRVGWAHNSSHMACAYQTADMDAPAAFVQKAATQNNPAAPMED